MARTKIVQVAPDVSLEVEESPLDSLNRIISTGTAIANLANTLESRSLKKEKDALGVGSLANQLISNATSMGEINNAISLLDDVDISDFSATTQSTFEVVKKDAQSKFNQINEVKSLGNQIAEFVSQPLLDGKTFTQLTANEITDYFYNNKESYDDGALSVIKDNISNIKRFQALTGSLSGDNKKMLNMTFTGSGGKILKASEFLVGVEDYLKAKDIYLRTAIYDGELDPEEALFIELGDSKGYDEKRKELDSTFKELKNDYDAEIKSYNTLIGQVRKKMVGADNTLSFINMSEAEFISTFGDDNAKDKLIDSFSLQNPELIVNPDDRDGALKIIYQYNKNSPGDANAFIKELTDAKRIAEGDRKLVANKAKKWGFRYFDALDLGGIDLSNANVDGGANVGTTFMDSFKKGIVPPEINITLPELKKYNFDNFTIKTEDKKEDMPLNAGTTSIITSVMKKYEGINQDTNPNLVEANNLYAIKFGNRAESYGAKDSGIQASDGGTFASFNSLEEADIAASKIVADMLDKDAEGDLKTFIGNYIGATPDNPKTDEINTRYNEIVELSTALPKTVVKPLTSKEINPKALDRAEGMFLKWKTKIEKSIDSTKNKIESIENKIVQIEKNTKTKEGSLTTKQKQTLKTKQKFKKQLESLKNDLGSETKKLKNTDIDNWYNNFATELEVNRLIKIGVGSPKQEVEEDAFLKGIADIKGIPSLDEGILKTLYDELRPGSSLRNR